MTNPKVRPSQDHAWDPDIKRWVFRPAGDGKPQNRVLESSKSDSTKAVTTKKVTSQQAKKASENIKKHLNGGLIQKYKGGRPISQVGTSDPVVLYGRTERQTAPIQLGEVVVTAPSKKVNSLGGGLYQWMTENGLQSLASFQTRKKLAANYGIPNYIGTAQQNALLQNKMQEDLGTHINIADRLNY